MSETLQRTFEDEQFQRIIAEARAAERVRSILGLRAEEQAPPPF